MKYLSGIKALNIPCNLDTTGDWHIFSYDWSNNQLLNSNNSIFKDYGIELNKTLPDGTTIPVANHIRACLDMLEKNDFTNLQGMKNDYICCDKYNDEIFKKVLKLKNSSNWMEINNFMRKEYKVSWINFEKAVENNERNI